MKCLQRNKNVEVFEEMECYGEISDCSVVCQSPAIQYDDAINAVNTLIKSSRNIVQYSNKRIAHLIKLRTDIA